MDIAIVVFPGSNREKDVAKAFIATGRAHCRYVWHGHTILPKSDLIVLPGGFSYGDYLRCGAIAARSPIMQEVRAAAAKGIAVLGICNGFQILTEAGLLPGVLLPNRHLKFNCRAVSLEIANAETLFTGGYRKTQTVTFPIAHHDGNYFADDETLDRLEGEGRVAFRYVTNPNGSARNIAGIFNEGKTVLGLMPHPENAIQPYDLAQDGRLFFSHIAAALS